MITIKKAVNEYLKSKSSYLKPSSIAVYSARCRYFIQKFDFLDKITNDAVQSLIIDFSNEGKSKNTIRDYLTTLDELLKFGEKKGYCKNFEFNVDYPTILKSREKESKSFSVVETKKIRSYLIENIFENSSNLAILIALNTGLRIGEITGLKFSDFNFETGFVSVNRTAQRISTYNDNMKSTGTYINVGPPKTKSSIRRVPVIQDVLEIVKDFYAVEKIKRKHNELNEYIFMGARNKNVMDNRSLRGHYSQILKKLGIAQIPFHSLRHSFASNCLASNIDVKTTSSMIGHSNVRTTLDIYAHPSFEQKKIAIGKLGKLFG